ncbi:uncharacterized protein LOC120338071 [Styela clava]
MYYVIIFLVSFLNLFSSTTQLKCELPETVPELDVDKLTYTKWYTGLQTDDPASNNVKCEEIVSMTKTSNGYDSVLRSYTESKKFVEWTSHLIRQRAGVFKETRLDGDVTMMNAYAQLENKTLNTVVYNLVRDDLEKDEIMFISDYRNYQAGILCTLQGQWIIRVYFPSPTPTVTNVVAFFNEMHRLGISTRLLLSEC